MNSHFLRNSLLLILGLAVILVTGHIILLKKLLPQTYNHEFWWSIPLFLFIATTVTIIGVHWRFRKDNTAAGRTYFTFIFLKIFGSLAFLFPVLNEKNEFTRPFAVQFLVLFFILLFIEIILLARLLNSPFGEKLKNDENQ